MKTTRAIGEAKNIATVMKHGPALRYNQSTFIVSRDRARKHVCVGGFGSFGVGRRVEEESDYHRDYPDFETAPEMDLPMTSIEELERMFRESQSCQPPS